MSEQVIVISADGRVRFVWDDALAALNTLGTVSIVRVADVEPTERGEWLANCERIGGGVYGPYPLRESALAHERRFVTDRLIRGRI